LAKANLLCENRPLSVTHGGATTTYTYGADGTRLLRTDPSGNITATFGPVEIRNVGSPAEQVLTYPHPDIRITNGTEVTYLHRDHLNSVVAMTDAAGARAEARVYTPFGEIAWQDGGTNSGRMFDQLRTASFHVQYAAILRRGICKDRTYTSRRCTIDRKEHPKHLRQPTIYKFIWYLTRARRNLQYRRWRNRGVDPRLPRINCGGGGKVDFSPLLQHRESDEVFKTFDARPLRPQRPKVLSCDLAVISIDCQSPQQPLDEIWMCSIYVNQSRDILERNLYVLIIQG
jgi:YD repeat-containing protein